MWHSVHVRTVHRFSRWQLTHKTLLEATPTRNTFAFSNENNSSMMIINPRLALMVLLAIMVVGNVHGGTLAPVVPPTPSKTKKVSMTLRKTCRCGVEMNCIWSFCTQLWRLLTLISFVKYLWMIHSHCCWKRTERKYDSIEHLQLWCRVSILSEPFVCGWRLLTLIWFCLISRNDSPSLLLETYRP